VCCDICIHDRFWSRQELLNYVGNILLHDLTLREFLRCQWCNQLPSRILITHAPGDGKPSRDRH